MQEREYIQLLIQSLEKKVKVLQEIADNNIKQKELLLTEKPDMEAWEAIVKDKANQIEQLRFLDEGFESTYSRVKEELDSNRKAHVQEIRLLQSLIAQITDLSVDIQAQEQRNKELAQNQFSKMKRQVRQVKQASKAAAAYRTNMKRLNVVDAQFLDRKN